MQTMNTAWIERQTGTAEARRQHEQERLILSATDAFCEIMEQHGLRVEDMAGVLGTDTAAVRKLLSGEQELTLRMLADRAGAVGRRVEITLTPWDEPAAC